MFRKMKFKIYVLSLTLFIIIGLIFSPFIYTPPALNNEILDVYTECIQIAKGGEYNWTLRVRDLDNSYLKIEGEVGHIATDKDCSKLEKYFPHITSDKYQRLIQKRGVST